MSSTPLQSITLVLGGARSGKSAYAEGLVRGAAGHRTYLATAGQPRDTEMADRISDHIARRGDGWTTLDAPLADPSHFTGSDPILIDCMTLWLSNMMEADKDWQTALPELITAMAAHPAPVVVVSNEIGLGLVPETPLGRRFRDAQGRLNQILAQSADCVVFVAAGLPLILKGSLS